jgi:hypothetical protein
LYPLGKNHRHREVRCGENTMLLTQEKGSANIPERKIGMEEHFGKLGRTRCKLINSLFGS